MDDAHPPIPPLRPKFLDQVREVIRMRHYSLRTEQAYLNWIRRFIIFHDRRHPDQLGEPEIVAFLSHLANYGHCSASTQNQALSALLFLYKAVLDRPLTWMDQFERAKKPARLPVVLTLHECQRLLGQLDGTCWLMASLLYGSGLRLMECLRLRVKDVDFDRRQIIVRDGKGRKDRATMLPEVVVPLLKVHLEKVKLLHQQDLGAGYG